MNSSLREGMEDIGGGRQLAQFVEGILGGPIFDSIFF